MGVRAKEDGKSEGRFVISETKRMTAVETQAGAVPNKQIDWTTIDWRTVNQNVRRLQARIVEATQAEVVKPRSEKSVGKA